MKHKKSSETYTSNSHSESNEKDSISLSSDSNSSNELYEAEEILAKKTKNGKMLYKVKWKDYPINQSTWEPISNFNNSSLKLIHKFEKNQKNISLKGKTNSAEVEDNKRFSKRLKVLSRKFIRPVEEIVINDSDSESSSGHRNKKANRKKHHQIEEEEDSSVDSNELSPYSSDSSENKKSQVENGKNTKLTHRSKKSVFKSRIGDIKHDKVKRIISGRITDTKNFNLNCLLEFEKRSDGYTPEPKHFSSDIVRVHSPQCLIDFYQSRISINKKSP